MVILRDIIYVAFPRPSLMIKPGLVLILVWSSYKFLLSRATSFSKFMILVFSFMFSVERELFFSEWWIEYV